MQTPHESRMCLEKLSPRGVFVPLGQPRSSCCLTSVDVIYLFTIAINDKTHAIWFGHVLDLYSCTWHRYTCIKFTMKLSSMCPCADRSVVVRPAHALPMFTFPVITSFCQSVPWNWKLLQYQYLDSNVTKYGNCTSSPEILFKSDKFCQSYDPWQVEFFPQDEICTHGILHFPINRGRWRKLIHKYIVSYLIRHCGALKGQYNDADLLLLKNNASVTANQNQCCPRAKRRAGNRRLAMAI